MKAIISLLVLMQVFSLCSKNHNIILKEEKKFNFGKYTVITGGCDSGSAIIILKDNKEIYQRIGGDGMFISIDTINITKDQLPDLIFSYAFDDYTTLGILVSINSRKKYKIINLTDEIYKSYGCSTEPLEFMDDRIKDFVISDINNDGKRDVITIAILNPDQSVTPTKCSKIFTHDQLIEISNLK